MNSASPSSSANPRKVRLRTYLMGLALAAALPLLVYAFILAALLTEQQKGIVEASLTGSTRVFAAAIDEKISAIISGLTIFAASEDFESGNFLDLYRRASRVVVNHEDWFAIALTRPDGQMVLNTFRPFGAPLPQVQEIFSFKEALRTGRPAVSGYHRSVISGEDVIAVHVPVLRNGKVVYVLGARLRLTSLSALLKAQSIPEGWTAAVVDSEGVIIARSRDPELFLGQPATPALRRALKEAPDGIFEDETKEGRQSIGAFGRSRVTGWAVVLGIPKSAVRLANQPVLTLILGGGLALLFLGVAIALLIGQKIARPIMALSDMAQAIGFGARPEPVQSRVAEVAQVAGALETAARERRASDSRAQEAIQLRDNFLSVASHELKTPLTALQLQFQLLLRRIRKGPLPPDLPSTVEKMITQVKRLSRLVDELLDVSRISSGKIELNPETLDLSALLGEISAHFAPESDRTGSELSLDAAGPVEGRWDRSRLEQVFTNLIANAFKYGTGKPIAIRVWGENGWAMVSVQDFGIGIADADQKRIFERFERAVSNRNYGGLGLGLWIVQRVVESLGGEVLVESTPGEGSKFTVRLPRQEQKPEPETGPGPIPQKR